MCGESWLATKIFNPPPQFSTGQFLGLDLLQTTRIGRGTVSGRVALLLRSTEIKPFVS